MHLGSGDQPRDVGLESEKMLRELERLRKENSELRRRLGMSVAEPTVTIAQD